VEERLEYENDLFKRQMFPSTNYKTEILPNPAINYPDHPSSDFPSRNFVDNVPSLKYGSIYCCDTPGLGNPIARKYNSSDDSAKFDQFVQWVNLDFTPKQNGKRRQNIKFKISNNIYWCSSVVITDASTVLNLLRSYTRLHRLGKLIGDPNKIILGKFKNENWHNSKSVEEVVKWLLEIE
jgi:hypothetical protein